MGRGLMHDLIFSFFGFFGIFFFFPCLLVLYHCTLLVHWLGLRCFGFWALV